MASIDEQLSTVLKTIKELEAVVMKLSEEQKRKDEDIVTARYCFYWKKLQPGIEVVYKDGATIYVSVANATKGQKELASKGLAKEHAPVHYSLH
jgi:hypothetical protein